MVEPKPISPERLSEIQEIAEHPSPRQLVETDLIRELFDDRGIQFRRLDALRERLQDLSERWHESALEHWFGKEKSCGDHDDGKGDGLDDCADEIDALLAEVFGG